MVNSWFIIRVWYKRFSNKPMHCVRLMAYIYRKIPSAILCPKVPTKLG